MGRKPTPKTQKEILLSQQEPLNQSGPGFSPIGNPNLASNSGRSGQISFSGLAGLPAGIVSGSSQVLSGKESQITKEYKERWMTLKCLMGSLDIDSDVELAESKAALQLILDNYKSTMY